MDKSKKQLIIGTAIVLLLAIGGGIGAAVLGNKPYRPTPTTNEATSISEPAVSTDVIDYSDDWDSSISYNGTMYHYNEDLTTILFMGVDSHADVAHEQYIGNGGRADTLMLFILNNETNTMDILEINRDIYYPVDVYDDTSRTLLYTGSMQISMQYAFSDSPAYSCHLMKNKVQEILYGIPIDYYCSLTLDGMNAVVDAMGGLEITFEEDLTYIDPSFVAGETIVMDSAQSERFFRYRDINELGSNQDRMNRQTWFMRTLFQRMMSSSGTQVANYYNAAGEYLTTDMDLLTIQSIRNYSLDEIYMTPGVYEEGVHDIFILDDDELMPIIIDLLYVEEQ